MDEPPGDPLETHLWAPEDNNLERESMYFHERLKFWKKVVIFMQRSLADLWVQRMQVRAGIALAIALEKILILPKLTCFCDRSWWDPTALLSGKNSITESF